MGSCVSIHRNIKASQVVVSPSPIKQKPNDVSVLGFKSQASPAPPLTGFQHLGSKDETFFDSQAWLDSDCDDDFLSVNGDFTPSRGNTPNGQYSFLGTPQLNKSLFMNKASNLKPEASPTEKKKRLSELFQESGEADKESDYQNATNGKKELNMAKLDFQHKGTPYISGANSICSSDITPNRPEKEKLSRIIQCCLPSLIPSRRSSEKMISSPQKNGG